MVFLGTRLGFFIATMFALKLKHVSAAALVALTNRRSSNLDTLAAGVLIRRRTIGAEGIHPCAIGSTTSAFARGR